jgi:putative transposase
MNAGHGASRLCPPCACYNPVKHGRVTLVADRPHSRFHSYVERSILPVDWAGEVGELSGSFGE